MGFADAGWPEEQEVFGFTDEPAGGQVEDLFAVDRRIKAPVKVLQGFEAAEVGGLGASIHQALVADVQFVLADQFQELGVTEPVGGGFLQTNVQGLGQAGEPELFECGFKGIHGSVGVEG